MANESNLIPGNKRSQSEARENGKKGGIASGKARRKKADLRRAFETILQADVASDGVRRHLEALGFEATNEMALAMVMMQKAMKGDVRAFEQISRLTSIGTKDALDRKEQKERIKSLQLQNEVKRKAANDDDSTEQIIVVDRWTDD